MFHVKHSFKESEEYSMKTITINGVDFELIKPRIAEVKPFRGWFCDEEAIFNCYDRPSLAKIGIWNSWLKWARDTDGIVAFEITSYNCMQFTIGGGYVDDNGDEYVLYITRAHNRAYKVTN